jgi:hypothetical protein
LIEMIARDVYFLDEVDRRIFMAISKAEKVLGQQFGNGKKMRNPNFIAILRKATRGQKLCQSCQERQAFREVDRGT